MTGFRIIVDIEALVRDAYSQLPWRRRVAIWFKRGKEQVIAEAIKQMTGDTGNWAGPGFTARNEESTS